MGRSNHLTKIKRLFQLQHLMKENPTYDADHLADVLGVSKRTVYRDLQTLGDMGVRVEFDREQDGYKIHDQYALSPAFSLDEAVIMEIALESLPDKTKQIFTETIAAIRQKIHTVYQLGDLAEEAAQVINGTVSSDA